MKEKILIAITLFFLNSSANAQFYKSLLPSPGFTDSISTIVKDFKLNYRSIQSEVISEQADVDIYASTFCLPGSVACYIYRFHSTTDTTASFQALMYKGENFKEAAKIYRNTFRLVNKSKVKMEMSVLGFSGSMQEPSSSAKFVSSRLDNNSADNQFKNYIAEVEMVYLMDGWEVRLNLHKKKADTDKYMQ